MVEIITGGVPVSRTREQEHQPWLRTFLVALIMFIVLLFIIVIISSNMINAFPPSWTPGNDTSFLAVYPTYQIICQKWDISTRRS